MFARLSSTVTYVFLMFAVLATASPWATTTVTVTPVPTSTQPASQCNTGPIQCCNSVTSASNDAVGLLLGLLGVVINDLTVLVGLNCSPVIGNSCSAQAVCCENDNFSGLIVVGCSPVNLNL